MLKKKTREQLTGASRSCRSKSSKLERVDIKKAGRAEHLSVEDILRASDERYRPLFDNMLDGFAYCKIILDEKNQPTDFIYIDVNSAFEKLTGLNKEDVIGKRVTEVMPGIKEVHPELFDIYGEVALAGKETKFEIYFEPLGIWLSISAYSLSRGYFVIMFENIGEQKQAEEEREVMIKLLSLINSSNHMHEMMRLVTVFLRDWSQCEAVGIRLAEGEDYPYFVTSGFSDEFVQAENSLCSVNETGEPVRDNQGRLFLECMCGNVISGRYDPSRPFFTRNGSFWTSSTTDLLAGTTESDRLAKTRNRCNTAGYESVALVPLRAGGEIFGLLQFNSKQKGLFTPAKISLLERLADNLAIGLAQRKAEQSLEKSEEMFRSIFETNIIGVAICSPEKRWLYVNDRICEILGYSREELCRMTWDKLTYPDDLEADVSLFNRLMAGEIDKYDLEKRFIRKDGSVIYAKIYVSCRRNRYGNVEYNIGLLEDITERKRAEEALRVSEARLSEAIQIAKLGYWEYDVAEGLFTFTDQFYSVYRTSAEQVGGYKLTSEQYAELFLFPEEVPELENEIRTAIEATDPNFNHYVEHRVRFGNGETGYVSVRYFIIKDSQGRTIKTYGVNQDITERRQAEEALRASEARYRSYIDLTSDIAWVTDADGNVVEDIPSWRKFTGQSYEEAKGSGWASALHPDDVERTLALWRHAVSTKSEYVAEYRMRRYDGEYRYLLARGVPVMDEDGNVLEWVGTCIDVTGRTQAEKALKESEIRFRELFESMSSGVAVYEAIDDGEDFVFKNMNRAGERIDKIRRAELIGKKVTEVFPGIKEIGLFKVFQEVLRTGEPQRHPVSLYKDKRLAHWVENYVYKLPTGEIVAVYDDVTKRKEVEEKLYEYQNQLKSMASQVSKVQEQERRNIAVEMHDRISQRLAMAKVDIQIAAKSSADAKISAKLRKTAGEIGRVIEDAYSLMVELSNPVLYEIGLKAAIESLLKKRIGPEKKIDYVLEADDSDFKLDDVISVPLYQAVRELLRNVIKHSKANKVVVSIHKVVNSIQITVRDNGIGFDACIVGKPNKIKTGGFGIFSTKENIEHINGKLEIKSEPGRGTVAIINVPLEYKTGTDLGGKE